MEKIYTDLTLDFRDNRSMQTVKIKQGDSSGGRVIRISLTNNGQSVSLNSASDTASLYAAVGKIATAVGQACTIDGGKVCINVTENLAAAAGVEHCEIRIDSGGGRVHTAQFDILVGQSAVTDDMPEVVASADLIDRISEIENAESGNMTKSLFCSNIRSVLSSVFPEYTHGYRSETVTSESTILERYYLIPKTAFDPEKDGLLIWKDNKELVESNSFHFDDAGDNIRVNFHNDALGFEIGDVAYFQIYKKPSVPTIVTCTQAQYNAIAAPDADTIYIITG